MYFDLLFAALTGTITTLWRSSIVRYYLVALTTGIITVTVMLHGIQLYSWADAIRYWAFQALF